ncbi:hypothetical protein VTJ49DRAFT_987 [Mycothermus thermophilus]|uniref:Core Histone H2A/H2B/H3 domain-containing protein n=1 Tax=Humicola insolens TaxID=85995 RepID=A0ABR3VF90_HUMIN
MDPQNQNSGQHNQHGQQARQMPAYDLSLGGHYGASAAISAAGYAPSDLYTGTWANVHQGLTGHYKDVLTAYWQHTISHLESDTHDYKMHQLPLARIKKVMKTDPEVKMISAEAPILFAKGCDIFITELTMRAWIHAEENKRRTLQRSDIASALAKSDMFDFLIDIVPREEASSHAKRASNQAAAAAAAQQSAAAQQPQIPGVGAPNHAGQHPMATADYTLGGQHMATEADYRQPQTMYPGQVQPGAPAYGQPQAQMYNVDDMYPYGAMPPQQVCTPPPHRPFSLAELRANATAEEAQQPEHLVGIKSEEMDPALTLVDPVLHPKLEPEPELQPKPHPWLDPRLQPRFRGQRWLLPRPVPMQEPEPEPELELKQEQGPDEVREAAPETELVPETNHWEPNIKVEEQAPESNHWEPDIKVEDSF